MRLDSLRADFYEIWYLRIFRKSVEKIQVLLNSDENKRHFTWRHVQYIYDISLSPQNEKYFWQKLYNK